MNLDVEMVMQIINALEWRVLNGHPLIIAGVMLRPGDLKIADRKYRQLMALDYHQKPVWMITARWLPEFGICEAFIAGDIDKLKTDWVMLKLMKSEWDMSTRNEVENTNTPASLKKGWTMSDVLTIKMYNDKHNQQKD
jgi:hypothetical protein